MSKAPLDRTEELLADVAWARRLAAGLVGDAHLADELAQETWLLAARRSWEPGESAEIPVTEWSGASGSGAGLRRAFLAGVIRNLAAKARRSDGRRARHEERAAREARRAHADGAGDLVARAALSRELVTLVMALDEPFRTAILMRYQEELPPREIARRLGLSVRTVGSRLRRGLERLRDDLDRRGGGRETWLPSVVALSCAGAVPRSGVLGAILMGAKTSAAIAAGLVAATVLVAVRVSGEDVELAPPETAVAVHDDAARDGAAELAPAPEAAERVPTAPNVPATTAVAAPGRLVVRGRVIDAACAELGLAEAPGDGANVRVWASEKELTGNPGFFVPAGEGVAPDGAFTLELDDPGYRPVHLYVQADGARRHRGAGAAAAIPEGATAADAIVVVRPPYGVLHGVVRDDRGAPLAGVAVSAEHPHAAGKRVETRTDDAGAFRLAPDGHVRDLLAALPGFAQTHRPQVEPLHEGGYADVEIELVPAGGLVVRVTDADGRPAPGRELFLRLAPEELRPGSGSTEVAQPSDGFAVVSTVVSPAISSGRRAAPGAGAPQAAPPSRASTDELGVAVFADAWLGRKLELTLRTERFATVYGRHAAGRLLSADEEGGEALVIRPHGLLEVAIELPRDVVVRGSAVFPDGTPVPEPGFEVATRPADKEGPRPLDAGQGDVDGRFEARFSADRVEAELWVLAVDGTLGGGWGVPQSYAHAARVPLELAGAREQEGALVLEIECVIRPTGTIAGRVVDEEGAPVEQEFGTHVHAVPAGAPHAFARTSLGRQAWTPVEQGEFRIGELPAGVYDLYASRALDGAPYAFPSSMVRVPDVAVGTTGLEIVVPRAGGVSVRVELENEGSEPPDEMLVVVSVLLPADGRAPTPGAPGVIRGAALGAAWPPGVTWSSGGGGGLTSRSGHFQFGSHWTKEVAGHRLPDLGEGWYVFGVVPRRTGAISHFPVCTEPVYLRPGEHVARFALTPAAPLSGRVVSDSPVAHLAVALADADGVVLPQLLRDTSGGATARAVPLNASGAFHFAVAPIGARRLRIGTPAELERGEFRREVEVEVRPAEDAAAGPIEIRL